MEADVIFGCFFKMHDCSFELTLKKFVGSISLYVYKQFAEDKVLYYSMTELQNNYMTLVNYPYTL